MLITMTRNRVIDIHRQQSAQKRSPGNDAVLAAVDLTGIAEDSPGPGTAAAVQELLTEIRTRLKPQEIQIADLRLSGASWEEVGVKVGEPSEVLRKRFERALQRVRKEIGQNPLTSD